MKKMYTLALMGLLGSCLLQLKVAHAGDEHNHSSHEEHGPKGRESKKHGSDGHESEEVKTTISPKAAKKAGIQSEKVMPRAIQEKITLTGRIILNRNKTYPVRARFPGIVKEMLVTWGEKVTKGQVLAKIESNDSLKTYAVKAPRDGTVLESYTNIGDVAGDEPLFTVADISEVWAEFHVFPRDISQIKLGQKVKIRTLENGKGVFSTISILRPTADELTQTVIAIATVPNKEGYWRPGIAIEGDVAIDKRQAKVTVTENAIQRMEDKTVVFVKDGDATYVAKEVKLGKSDGEHIEVLSGLSTDAEYVSKGSFTIKADILKSTAEHSH